jgi:hypothetical protein
MTIHQTNTSGKHVIDTAQVAEWLRLFVEPGQVTELRALDVQQRYGRPQTVAGFFDHAHLDDMAAEALRLSGQAKGVYFVPNPINPDLLARICNRVRVVRDDETTRDAHILRRSWLFVDADPVRVSGVSATDAEKEQALNVILNVRGYLSAGLGWPSPILADSGNGYHLLFRIALPADDGGLVEHTLKALAARFDTDSVIIDQKVFNPGRVWKLYGSMSRKGDDIPTRPHRRSCVMEAP